jgi:hypothetical protein
LLFETTMASAANTIQHAADRAGATKTADRRSAEPAPSCEGVRTLPIL